MTITLEMILTHFFRNCPQRHKTDYPCSDRAISGIQLLPNHTKNLSPEFLYVTDTCPQDLPVKTPKDIYILCFSNTDDSPDETYLQFSPDRILLITDMELADGFNLLLQSYQHFADWERRLDFAVFRNTDFQELIDLSAEVITFPVLIYDSALKLLAYSTGHTALSDRIFQSTIANGYLDAEAVKYFDKTHMFEQMDNTGTAAGMSDQFREHDDLIVAINIHNELDYEGNFIVITIHSDIRQKPSENYFIQILRNNMINCRIFPYKQRIVILYHLPKFREANYKNYLTSQLTPILKDFSTQKLNLYFSRPFTTIGQFAAAYTQAENVCRLLRGNPKNMFSFYEEYCSLLNC